MEISMNSISRLDKFIRQERGKCINFLRKQFSLSLDDAEDVFQDSCIVMFNNIQSGKLTELTSSLATYLTGICMHKAMHFVDKQKRKVSYEYSGLQNVMIHEVIDYTDGILQKEKIAAVHKIVRNLPEPCDKISWGYYADELNMKDMADMYGYKNADTVKSLKSRCMSKFKEKYNQIKGQL